MDPNLFHIDWDQLLEVLTVIVVLSFIVERALALVFEHRAFIHLFDELGLKEPIAFAASFLVCGYWQIDVLSVLFKAENVSLLGEAITGAVVAGGSKASLKLFQEVLGVRSSAAEAARAAKNANAPQAAAPAAAPNAAPAGAKP